MNQHMTKQAALSVLYATAPGGHRATASLTLACIAGRSSMILLPRILRLALARSTNHTMVVTSVAQAGGPASTQQEPILDAPPGTS
jgi:hypothetical protein